MKSGDLIELGERFGGELKHHDGPRYRLTFGRDLYVQFYCYLFDTVPPLDRSTLSQRLRIPRRRNATAAFTKLNRKVYGAYGGVYRNTLETFYSSTPPQSVISVVLRHKKPLALDNDRRVEMSYNVGKDDKLWYGHGERDQPGTPTTTAAYWRPDTDGVVESWLTDKITDGMMLDWVWDKEGW